MSVEAVVRPPPLLLPALSRWIRDSYPSSYDRPPGPCFSFIYHQSNCGIMSDAPNFMQSPLAVWIQTFSFEPVSYKDLVDGIYLNEVLLQIDPKSSLEGIKNNVEDSKDKMINWEILLKNIRLFYQDVLDFYIVMKPPNIYAVCTHPESELARLELRKTLQLLLGCAINCEMKEGFIGRMTSLPEDVQVSMMGYIQELQDIRSNVIGSRLLSDDLDAGAITVYSHLMQLIQQRDEYLQEIRSLRLTIDEAEFDQSFLHSISIIDNGFPEVISRFAPSITTKSHKNRLIVELAECKAKLRKLRQDLEDRDDAISELEMESDSLKQTVQKFKNENLELTRNVRAIKSFQDELDVLRDKGSRCDRLEAEIQRYKEKMADLDFYKSRVEELRLDNSTLFESRSVMEEQLRAAHERIDAVVALENELQKCKEQRNALIVECDRLCIQAQNLIEENVRLEQENQVLTNARIEDELQAAVNSHKDTSASLYDQLSQAADSQVLKLEQENQALKQDLERIRESTMLENASELLALEKERSRLAAEVDRFLETSGIEERRYLELKRTNGELIQEKKSLTEAIEVLKETLERQAKESEEENHRLSQTIEALRERSEKTDNLRIKDLEAENKKLGEDVKQFVARVALLEQERRALNRRSMHLTDEAERCRVLERENRKFELENEELKRTLQASAGDRLRLEKEISALEHENQKLCQTVETLQETGSGKERLELENAGLVSKMQSLKENLTSAALSLSRVSDLEKETRDLKLQLEQSAEQNKLKDLSLEKLECENTSLNAENQRNKESLASLDKRIKECKHDLGARDTQNAELSRKIDDLKRSYGHLEDVEKQLNDLESEMEAIKKDKLVISKENKKLKQNLLTKESTIDDLTSKLTELELEIKTLSPLIERGKDVELNLSELEKKNLRIIQSATTDKRTIGVLQEDLVKEKIRCQQLQTDLENLRHQLSSSRITEKKSGIDEVDNLVKNMEPEIDSSKPSEVDVHGPSKERTVVVTQRYSNSPSATQDIINLKDHIVMLEKKNMTLEEKTRNAKRQNSELQGHVKQLESQISLWQSQLPSLQTQISNLQSQLATAEVENRMLLAENASVSGQNFHLQEECSKTEALVSGHRRQNEELVRNHETLERDLEKFQNVHDQLAAEHEALVVKCASLKDVYRGSKSDVKHLQQRCSELTREKETMAQLKTVLEADRENRKTESQHRESLRADYIHVREDNLRLLNAVDKASGELQERQKELRLVKGEVMQLKVRNDELATENAGLGKQISERNAEYSKQVFRLEEAIQWAAKLEEENRVLMLQMKLFISQNQSLLTKLLECKDQHIVEQKAYLERLTELRQQKEKLEERFMEQYRRYDPVKNKQRSIASSFVKRAKQMIKGKMRESGSIGSGVDSSGASDSLENTSCDPGSFGIKKKIRNTGAEGEDVPITLDEFLLECNQSPKSRRKLLVEKQVSLDENVDTVSNITQKPLRPRKPTIHDESGDDLKCLLKPFQSEVNISSRGDPRENYFTLPNKPRARSAVASSCFAATLDEFIGKGVDQKHMQWYHQSGKIPETDPISLSRFDHPTGFPSGEQMSSVPFRAKRTAQYIRSQSCYEGLWAANARYHETVKPDSIKDDEEDRDAKGEPAKRPTSLSSGYTSHEAEPCDLTNPSMNLGLVMGRPELSHVEGQQRKRGLASGDQRSVRPSSAMSRSASDDPGLGSRCCPGTVRDLVHSFQQAVKPSSPDSPHQSAADNKAVRPHSAAPAVPSCSSSNQSDCDIWVLRAAADLQFKPKDVREIVADPKPESNVCVVRPASGRALPLNPSDQIDINSCRNSSNSNSTVDLNDGASASRPVSGKTAKNKTFIDYGRL